MEAVYGIFSLMLAIFGWTIGQMFVISKKIGRLEGKIDKIEFALFGNDPGPEDGIYPIVDTLLAHKKALEAVQKALEELKHAFEEMKRYVHGTSV